MNLLNHTFKILKFIVKIKKFLFLLMTDYANGLLNVNH